MTSSPRLPVEPHVDQASIDDIQVTRPVDASSVDTLRVMQETLQVSKRQVAAGTVRVSTQTETVEDVAEVTLDHDKVEVTRVSVGHVVDQVPGVRTEGDTTIIPVVEERFVIVKQLYLKEELHIRRHVEREVSRIPVQLRRQTAVVERLDANGNVNDAPSISTASTSADPASK